MIIKRRELTPQEQETVRIQIQNIKSEFLKPEQLKFYKSLCSQYERDARLSDRQLTGMTNLKYASDMAKRHVALKNGKLNLPDNIGAQTDAKLNTVFNKIGR